MVSTLRLLKNVPKSPKFVFGKASYGQKRQSIASAAGKSDASDGCR